MDDTCADYSDVAKREASRPAYILVLTAYVDWSAGTYFQARSQLFEVLGTTTTESEAISNSVSRDTTATSSLTELQMVTKTHSLRQSFIQLLSNESFRKSVLSPLL